MAEKKRKKTAPSILLHFLVRALVTSTTSISCLYIIAPGHLAHMTARNHADDVVLKVVCNLSMDCIVAQEELLLAHA